MATKGRRAAQIVNAIITDIAIAEPQMARARLCGGALAASATSETIKPRAPALPAHGPDINRRVGIGS